MQSLHCRFSSALEALGPTPREALSCAPSLRLQMGGEEKIYLADHRQPNGVYIQNALNRALELSEALSPTLLRMDLEELEDLNSRVLTKLGLPAPEESVPQEGFSSLYWQAPKNLRNLFREIIRSEISPEGMEFLCGSLFLLREEKPMLLCLQDDRWADLAAGDPEDLRPFAARFASWIPEKR